MFSPSIFKMKVEDILIFQGEALREDNPILRSKICLFSKYFASAFHPAFPNEAVNYIPLF